MEWRSLLPVIVICAYGFVKEFRPSEAYLFEFEHVTLNISEDDLDSRVYPLWTYSYLVCLIPVFLLTDLLLYKPVIIAEAVCYFTVWLLFDLAAQGAVFTQQIIECIYGAATATEIAYFAYLYVAVDKVHFKRVTSFSRGVLLGGRFFGFVLAQLIIVLKWGDYRTLNWITTGTLGLALLIALCLPMISWRSAYTRRFEIEDVTTPEATYFIFARRVLRELWSDFRRIYSDGFIVKWSLWWAIATCLFFQVDNYSQALWGSVQSADTQYNAIVQALDPFLAIPAVLSMERCNVDWARWGELALATISLGHAGLMFWQAVTPSVIVMYACFIAYRVAYETMITIAQFNLAERLATDSFGLVFGVNTFVALALQTALTFVVADDDGLHVGIRAQFTIYGFIHAALAGLFLAAAIIACRLRKSHHTTISDPEEDE